MKRHCRITVFADALHGQCDIFKGQLRRWRDGLVPEIGAETCQFQLLYPVTPAGFFGRCRFLFGGERLQCIHDVDATICSACRADATILDGNAADTCLLCSQIDADIPGGKTAQFKRIRRDVPAAPQAEAADVDFAKRETVPGKIKAAPRCLDGADRNGWTCALLKFEPCEFGCHVFQIDFKLAAGIAQPIIG